MDNLHKKVVKVLLHMSLLIDGIGLRHPWWKLPDLIKVKNICDENCHPILVFFKETIDNGFKSVVGDKEMKIEL